MPYIHSHAKASVLDDGPADPGQLNFAITMLLIHYVENHTDMSYAVVAEALSACTEAAAEFRRRVLVPLEDRKMQENGDVYPRSLIVETGGGS